MLHATKPVKPDSNVKPGQGKWTSQDSLLPKQSETKKHAL